VGKNDNTYEKRRREVEKKRKADEKLQRKRNKKDGVEVRVGFRGIITRSEPAAVDIESGPAG
jgi:hypothetical protein